MIDIRALLFGINMLKSKSTWIIIMLLIGLYFGYEKYGDQIIDSNSKLKEIKGNIDSTKEKIESKKEMIESIKKI